MCRLRSVSCMREKRRAERGKPYGYTPPAGNPPRAARTSLRPRTPSSPIHKKHHIMISPSSPPISSNPILVNLKRTLSQTQPRCSHILTYPARGPDPFSPHPTTNPSSATHLPTIVTSTISPHLPPRKIHPLSAPKSKPLAFNGISLLSRFLNNPSTLTAPPLQDTTHPDRPPSGRQSERCKEGDSQGSCLLREMRVQSYLIESHDDVSIASAIGGGKHGKCQKGRRS
jgi:hypothetical protein